MQLTELIAASSHRSLQQQRAGDLYALPYGLGGMMLHALLLYTTLCLFRNRAPLTSRPLQHPHLDCGLCILSFAVGLLASVAHQFLLEKQSDTSARWTIWAGTVNLIYLFCPLIALQFSGQLYGNVLQMKTLSRLEAEGDADERPVEAELKSTDSPITDQNHQGKRSRQDAIPHVQHRACHCLTSWVTSLIYPAICIAFTFLTATVELHPVAGWTFIISVPLITFVSLAGTAGHIIYTGQTRDATQRVRKCGGWLHALLDVVSSVFAAVLMACVPIYVDMVVAANKTDMWGVPVQKGDWQEMVFWLYVFGTVLPMFCA